MSRLVIPSVLPGAERLLSCFQIEAASARATLASRSPLTGEIMARVSSVSEKGYDAAVERAVVAFRSWRSTPAPRRGELIRLFAEELREAKASLGELVTLETGKIASEAMGEVQEMIDICDYAVGLSRQLFGLVIASERPRHRMLETWHPMGPTAVITAFNFPVAVWAWNAALALVCGNSVLWKPSERTPLCALATQRIFERACRRFADAPEHLSQVLAGAQGVGERIAADPRIPVVSATGSTRMGRSIAPRLAERFARPILELGGNNCAIVCPSADMSLVLRAIAFAALGTAGQRCTSLRRLLVHADVHRPLIEQLKRVYESARIGDPREAGVLMGPLIDGAAAGAMRQALVESQDNGAVVTGGARVETASWPDAFYVRPALVETDRQGGPMLRETFAPILYVTPFNDLSAAIEMQNGVSQGLSSCIFTNDLREAELFLSFEGSDCGIANVNIGPSGAEIGGAFGGEKETGGGREAGSDSWKAYMRRATSTINYGAELPLAQGVRFDV